MLIDVNTLGRSELVTGGSAAARRSAGLGLRHVRGLRVPAWGGGGGPSSPLPSRATLRGSVPGTPRPPADDAEHPLVPKEPSPGYGAHRTPTRW